MNTILSDGLNSARSTASSTVFQTADTEPPFTMDEAKSDPDKLVCGLCERRRGAHGLCAVWFSAVYRTN